MKRALLLLAAVSCAHPNVPPKESASAPKEAASAPNARASDAPPGASKGAAAGITFESLRDLKGKPVPVAVPGKVVLVDFWATWCEPCKTALPVYAKVYGDLRARGFEVVAVNVDEDDADVTSFLSSRPLPFTVLRDPGGQYAERMGVSLMPTSFLLGKDGAVASRHDGFDGETEALLRKQVAELIAK